MASYDFIDVSKLMHCGVYMLIQRGEVIYVGKSKQPLVRLATHVRNRNRMLGKNPGFGYVGPTYNGKGINFGEIKFLPCMLGQLDVLEMTLIKQYMPKFNIKHNPEAKPRREREYRVPIPEDIKALLAQMVSISGLPPLEDTPKVYIQRRL